MTLVDHPAVFLPDMLEVLGLAGRLAALHLLVQSSRWQVPLFGAVQASPALRVVVQSVRFLDFEFGTFRQTLVGLLNLYKEVIHVSIQINHTKWEVKF